MGPVTPTRAYGIAVAIFALDRITKYFIESRMRVGASHTVIPGLFDIVHARNTGAAFSLFHDSAWEWRTAALLALAVAAVVLIAGMLRKAARMEIATALGLALILGGALGNIYDRALTGAVTDFLDFYVRDLHWPAFNVADSAIVTGSGLLLLDMVRPRRQPA